MSRLPNQSLSPAAGIDLQNSETHPLLSRIGETPLLPLLRVGHNHPGVQFWAKLEGANPGGSVKDRPARQIILSALRNGELERKVLLDATSGNTGIAYAMLGATLDFPVKLTMPAHVSAERKRILRAYGADLILTDPLEGTDGAIREARRLVESEPARYYYADQYSNPENWRAHEATTGPEIWDETGGSVTHLVAGLGTSGTMMGTGLYLKAQNPDIQLIAVQPDGPFHGLEGLKHMETALVPGIYDPDLPNRQIFVATETAYDAVKRLAREEGLLVGLSSGAALVATLQVAEELREGVMVVIFPDGGMKYLSETFWESR